MADLGARWGHRCAYCNKVLTLGGRYDHPDAPTCDHFIPRVKGGRRGVHNSVYACWACNQAKGAVDPRRLLWVWARLDPQGLVTTLLHVMEADPPPRVLNLVVDNTVSDGS